MGSSDHVDVLLARFMSVYPLGAVTVAVLSRGNTAVSAIVAVAVNVTVPPTGMSAVVVSALVPVVAPVTVAPPVTPVTLQFTADRPATPNGNASAITAPRTSLEPPATTRLLTTIVYEIGCPGAALTVPVFTTDRSPCRASVVVHVDVLLVRSVSV